MRKQIVLHISHQIYRVMLPQLYASYLEPPVLEEAVVPVQHANSVRSVRKEHEPLVDPLGLERDADVSGHMLAELLGVAAPFEPERIHDAMQDLEPGCR